VCFFSPSRIKFHHIYRKNSELGHRLNLSLDLSPLSILLLLINSHTLNQYLKCHFYTADLFIHYGYIFIIKFVNARYKNTNHKEQQRYPKKTFRKRNR
jgi:hypothetical protein